MSCTAATFREMGDRLRTVAPVPRGSSLTLARVSPFEFRGDCGKVGRKFKIRVTRGLSVNETLDILIHEWAHMLEWRADHPLSSDHGPGWGVWHACVYRAYHGTQ